MISHTGTVLGIDVGFSNKRRSSAICRLDWDDRSIRWTIDRFRADVADRHRAIKDVSGGAPVAVAAFDGPLRRGFDTIGRYRTAESMLTRRLGPQIGKPGQSSTPLGKRLNNAANDCVAAVRNESLLAPAKHEISIDNYAIVEAFPSSFLGLMIADPTNLAAQRGDRSDVYFEHLSDLLGQILAHLLPGREMATKIKDVTNHDDRAAFVCALTALGIEANDFTAVGDEADGWIILPPRTFIRNWAWNALEANAGEGANQGLYSTARAGSRRKLNSAASTIETTRGLEPMTNVTKLSSRFDEALIYATHVHGGQARKGTSTPYIAHLLAVAATVLEYGGDEDLAIAALLHDSAEDQGGQARLNDVRNRFGVRVAKVVEACSDSLADTSKGEIKADWETRKRAYIGHLMSHADSDVLQVSLADKVHNARAILRDLRKPDVGELIWKRFSQPKEKTLWYYAQIAEVFQQRLGGQLADELHEIVDVLKR